MRGHADAGQSVILVFVVVVLVVVEPGVSIKWRSLITGEGSRDSADYVLITRRIGQNAE